MLEEDTLDGREVVSGYVFQDPWTRELWPRMVVSEERQAVEYPDKSKGYPRLLWGTRGSPRTEYAHLVFPEAGLAPVTPRPEHILQASVQQSRRARRNTLEPSAQEEISLGSPSYALLIDRTALLEAAPRAVFLVTYLYLPAESERGSKWNVCDPFGFEASPRLRSTLEQRLRTDPSLVDEVCKLYGEAVDDAEEGLASSMALLEREARFRVQARLGVAMQHPSLRPSSTC